MLNRIFTTCLSGLLCLGALAAAAVPPKRVENEIIVKFNANANNDDVNSVKGLADADQNQRLAKLKSGSLWRLHSRSKNVEALLAALQHNPHVEYAEPNYVVHSATVPNDPNYPQQWALKNTGPFNNGSDIDAESAWSVTTGSSSIVIGVLDTGVDYTHPDLAANIWSNPGGKGNAACGAGTHGFDAIAGTCDPKESGFHGTAVAGIIGAGGNNGIGIAGVNWTTSIMALKFLDYYGNGSVANGIAAIDFAVQAKIDGVNLRILSSSWTGAPFSKALLDEINKAGENDILFVTAAGNYGGNIDNSSSYPASYVADNMIVVTATDGVDQLPYWASYGSSTVHLGAPGVSIYTTYPGAGYTYVDGTSIAAPHVAGVAGLVLAHAPSLTTAQVKSAILDNVDRVSGLAGKTKTGGRLNAARALGLPARPTFSISLSPALQTVAKGGTAYYTLKVTPLNGFSSSVTLSVTGLPSGVSASFNPSPAQTGSVLTLRVDPSASSTYYPYSFAVVASGGGVNKTASASIQISSTSAAQQCPSFASAPVNGSAGNSSASAVADFNQDGRPDIAVVNPAQNRLYILTNVNSTFQGPGTPYTVGNGPIEVTAADLNRDGYVDLITANSGANNVSVLLGAAGGLFAPAVNFPTGKSPFDVAAADVNRDGKLDLITVNNGGSGISVLLGNGDGTFQAPVDYATGSGPYHVVITDLDRNGTLDLAVACYNSGQISILRGNGDGTFAASANYSSGAKTSAIRVVDFNGDGIPDIAAVNFGSNDVSVFAGNGDATLQAAIHYPAGTGPSGLAVLDFNGDGISDLAVAGSANSLTLLAGDGTSFAQTAVFTLYGVPNDLISADINGDGKPDLVTSNAADSGLTVILNNGVCSARCGVWLAHTDSSTSVSPLGAASADFNRDGHPDLAVTEHGANSVRMFLNNAGGFSSGLDYSAGTGPAAAAAGDFDRDGKLDLAVVNDGSNNVSILMGNGDGTLQPAQNFSAGTTPKGIITADFNRDGIPDLATANSGSNDVSILIGNGNGTFASEVRYAAGSGPLDLVAADFNHDGRLDLAVANAASNNVSMLQGLGDGTFAAATSFNAGTSPSAILARDLDSNGTLDLAVANSGSNDVSILLGDGNGSFAAAVSSPAGSAPGSITAGDFDGDGLADLAVTNTGLNSLSILTGTGTSTFATGSSVPTGTGPVRVLALDSNSDGDADLAVVNSGDNTISLIRNTCPVPDLSITKTHTDTFAQGSSGKHYTITVTNAGLAATAGTVTVVDNPDADLTITDMSGTGWACTVSTRTCSRGDALAAGASYPAITVTVSVASNAKASVTNVASVSGGGQLNPLNDTARDTTSVSPATDLLITASHTGNFTQGDTGRKYTISVKNVGGLATSGTVSVTDTLPAGLSATAISGTGWSCTLASLTCARSDALAGGASFPAITLTIDVSAGAAAHLVNAATVSGGGESNVANDVASDMTIVWSRQTCASFGKGTSIGPTPNARTVVTADFNGDGKADLSSAPQYSNVISVSLGNGDGTFITTAQLITSTAAIVVVAADVNEDGKLDLVALTGTTIVVFPGNGDGTFRTGITTTIPNSQLMLAADMNSDGHVDIVCIDSSSNLYTLLGNGNGSFRDPITTLLTTSVYDIKAVDFNRDGILDLALLQYNGIVTMQGHGDGTYAAGVVTTNDYTANAFAIADLNRDGDPDLIVATYYGLHVVLNNGDGTFSSGTTYGPMGSYYYKILVDDVNGDGMLDILASSNSYSYGNTVLYAGKGDGLFQPSVSLATGSDGSLLLVGEFDGDGRADLLTQSYNGLALLRGGCPDLTITSTHNGDFVGGQTGIYYLRVANSGAASTGTITVTESVPSPLTFSTMSGPGWTCTNTSCTRSDSLASTSYFPDISVSVNVPLVAPPTVTASATVSGGGDTNNANNSANDLTNIVQSPDLTIAMTHTGTFAQGQFGKTYKITVGNAGGSSTTGVVTVTDTLPSGLTATSISGSGWSCSLSPLTCSRNDSLGATANYPPIALTVSVATNCADNVTNYATVSGGGDSQTSNNSVYDATSILTTPSNLAATAASSSAVIITWNAAQNAASYEIVRSSNNGQPVVVGSTIGNSFVDSGLVPNTTYIYRVRGIDAYNSGMLSNPDIATTIIFTDDPLIVNVSTAKAAHITELRTAVNAVRAAAGLSPASFTDSSLTGRFIKAAYILELRTALNEARTLLGVGDAFYVDPTLSAGMRIKAAHITDLRNAVK